MADRAKDVENNANWMVRSAHAVAGAWGAAWTAMKGGNSQGPMADTAKALQDQIDKLTQGHQLGKDWIPGISAEDPRVKKLQAALADVRSQQFQAGLKDVNDQLNAKANADAIAAQRATSQFDAPDVKRDNAIAIASKHMADQLGVNGLTEDDKARIRTRYANEVTAANEAFNSAINKGIKKPKKAKTNPEVNAYQTFSGQVDSLDIKSITDDDPALTKYQQGIAKLGDELNTYMRKNGDATKGAELFLRGQKALQAQLDQDNAKQTTANAAYAAALDKKNAALQLSVDNQVAQISMGAKEYQQQQQIAKVYADQAGALANLALQRQKGTRGESGGISKSQFDFDTATVKEKTDQAVAILQNGYT